MLILQKPFSGDGGSAVRSFIRAITLVLTAFVLSLTPEQIGSIQLALEAAIALAVKVVPNPPAPGG